MGLLLKERERILLRGCVMGMELGRRMKRFFSAIITDFYTHMFTSSNTQALDRVLDGVDAVVIETMSADLMRPFTSEEVGMAIKEMAPAKRPRSRWYDAFILPDLLD